MVPRALPLLLSLLLASLSAGAASRQSAPSTHVVADGQRLGSIAKRYGVSIEALCAENGITRRDPIHPGQRLRIPGRSVPGSIPAADESRVPVHRVESGQTLDAIARRYRVSVAAICEENRIERRSVLRPGQVLRVPGARGAASLPTLTGRTPAKTGPYARAPKQKGFVELVSHNRRYRGQVFDRRGQIQPKAKQAIASLLGVGRNGPRLDDRLIRNLVNVSDHFGGRPLRIVSGYRSNSYFKDSKHKASRAVDFSVIGVPNEALRDYLRTFGKTGVGYYPNSSFVHLDVRDYAAYWVDYSRPGEAPRRSPFNRGKRYAELHDEEESSGSLASSPVSAVPALPVAGAIPSPPAETLALPLAAGTRAAAVSTRAAPFSPSLPVRALRPAPARARLGAPTGL